ncbi:MFS transporter [Paenibacillus marchantiophytorum]|uniref:MFS transporter n=1 Tax=Paenibacillus marchantiophytorum TaxID=1619310 RepID=A0ABQ1FEQ3_9BACL|nr:MFS transporter [Paenibacillus marchantiophytorum]GGA08340.1 MFS transporter [Paenibacillus marchantiophytorum]
MKYRLVIMFLIVLGGMISIAAFNPIIGPLSRNLGLSDVQSGSLVSIAGLCWLLGGYFWEKQTFMSRKTRLASIIIIYVATLIIFARLADYSTQASSSTSLFWSFFLLRAIAGFFFGGIPALAQAYIMGWTTEETRTRGMALFGAANGLGFVLGPAMSGGMVALGLTAPMYAAALLLFLLAILFLVAIPKEQEKAIERQANALSPNDGRIRLYLWIGLVLSFALNIVQVTIGFYVQDRLGYSAKQATQLIGLGLAISGVVVVLSQIVISKYLKWPYKRIIIIGLTFVALGLVGLLTVIRFAYLDFAVLGIGIGFTLLGYSAGASAAVQNHEQRSVAAFIAALQGGGSCLGPIAGTALYTANSAFPYSFCVLLIGISSFFVLRKRITAPVKAFQEMDC